MNFFRSEEHLRNWKNFQEKKKGGIIVLSDLMRLFSGPYFTKRREPNYLSNMGEYTTEVIATLDDLENAGSFWRLKWYEKLGFSLAIKLGLI
ncbi:MAG: hypothetical protein SWO11_17830 [Thermodesulfobacteriota bacterium]|nr:hypothetical protein [Thermodesulfobacteriota bacterium]